MKMTLKILSAIILGFVLGWCANLWYTNHFSQSYIDSTKEEIKVLETKDSIIEVEKIVLKDSIRILWKEREIKVDSIKKLPLDSAIKFLKFKLEEYE